MKTSQLLNKLDTMTRLDTRTLEFDIQGIADNSRDVEEGYAFVAIEGFENDGHCYIDQAIEKGAVLVIGEQDLKRIDVPYLQVKNSRKAIGIMARNFYGHPSNQKVMIGITGTNGKTTTSYMLQHILESNGKTCSVIGTIQNIINGEKIKSTNTTPSSLALHKLLSLSQDEIILMEVSSHGLAQYRLEGIEFDYGLFTNLHHEHLDYHGSMEDYFQAKQLLFKKLKSNGTAIVNIDDFWGIKMAEVLSSEGIKVYRIGMSNDSQLRISDFDLQKSTTSVVENKEHITVFSPMYGMHNMYNTLMTFGTVLHIGINKRHILRSLLKFPGVEGRFEISEMANGSTVVVDYAHTPDAIFHCLTTAKQRGAKRIIHVFGFRGNRYQNKRKEMITITSDLSDQYILTMDDLNSVAFDEMVDVLEEASRSYGNEKGSIIPDRTLAIQKAMTESLPGDWIVITGKGHEKYQQNFQLPTHSDRDTVQFLVNQNKNE